ncbi:MAG: flagellar hook protein FlgE [Nitrospirae bacterium]|nr:MAG: flagellar hook protein FlgE [Nitrospirota bacterium]
MLTSLFTGVSGLNTNGQALSIVGDNIANSNTVGFKGSRSIFGDVLSQALGGSSAVQIGRGASMLRTQALFTQGNFETSNNPLDMAVDGEGFFVVKEPTGGTFYTRSGQSGLDKDGYIVSPTGLRYQGYLYDANGNFTGSLGDVNVATVNSNPSASSQVNLEANLDSRESIKATAWSLVAASGPVSGCYNFNTTMTVYDSQGNDHPVSIYYRKTASNTWDAHFVYNNSATSTNYVEIDFDGGTAGTQPLTLTFDSSGTLTGVDIVDTAPPGIAAPTAPAAKNAVFDFTSWVGGAATQTIAISMGYNGINTTQYGSPSTMVFQNQNGWTAGSLRALTISSNGVIGGVFTNGQVKNIAQVALSRFVSPEGLTKMGKSLYAQSFDSGQAVIGTPNTSGRGGILPNTVELSNVDIAEEFVRMIAAQRGFQANARVITTSDNMLAEVTNIVR